MHSNCRMTSMQGGVYERSDNVPYGVQTSRVPISPNEPHYNRVPDTTVPSAPGTPDSMCYGGTATHRTNPPEHTLLSLLTADQSPRSFFTPPPPPLQPFSAVTPDIVVPLVQPPQPDPSEQVVVKDGCVFYIRYVDEPDSEDLPVERNHAEGFCVASITNDPSMQLNDSVLPEVSVAGEQGDVDLVRDWINYDELPLLLNQQKQPQAVHTMDHVSRRSSSDTRGEIERCKECHKPKKLSESQTTSDGCWCAAAAGVMQPSLSNAASLEPTAVTMVPKFSHYCVECEKFFPTGECLQEHMELHHRLIDDALPVMTTIPRTAYTEPEGPGGGYVWPCSTFVDSTNAGPKMPFFCDLCNISFNLADSYYMHNYSVHGRMGSHYR